MELEEFVTKVIVDLDKAVEGARKVTKRNVSFRENQTSRTVEFDIAVSAETVGTKSGKAGVKVLHFAEGGGELSKETKNATVSRISFGVSIDSATKEEQERWEREAQRSNYSGEFSL